MDPPAIGLVNASFIWQKCMYTVFQGVEQSKTYIDDTFVYSNGWQEHLGTLRALFSRCRQYNISVNLEKCNFGVQSVKCLGYVVYSQGVHVDEDKVSAIMSLPAPESVKDVKSFLGMAGYFRHFVQDFASISAPLAHLTKKSVKFRWCSNITLHYKMAPSPKGGGAREGANIGSKGKTSKSSSIREIDSNSSNSSVHKLESSTELLPSDSSEDITALPYSLLCSIHSNT